MNVFFVFDEYTDVEDADVVREMVDIVIDAIHNPEKPRPEGEVLLGELARQYVYSHIFGMVSSYYLCLRFWARGILTCTSTARKHFEESFTDYLNSVYDQALDRETNSLRTVESYFKTRRENIGARPSYMPAVLGIDIPDEAFYHPTVVELGYLIADLIILDNVSPLFSRRLDRTNSQTSPGPCFL